MGFEWAEFLALAEYLRACNDPQVDSEAAQRSAVSRAYYAIFCIGRNFAEQYENFRRLNDGEDHSRLQRHFENWKRSDVANGLFVLRRWRNQADYDDEVQNLAMLVNESIKRAKSLKLRLENAAIGEYGAPPPGKK